MTPFMNAPSAAHDDDGRGRDVVADLLSFPAPGRGRPSKAEQSLYLATMLFIYARWEQFVEALAVEVVGEMAKVIEPQRLPEPVKSALRAHDGWDLAVEPGWQGLWVKSVETKAVGDASNQSGQWGMNTANERNVRALFQLMGINDPIPKRVVTDPEPDGLRLKVHEDGSVDSRVALERLIEIRGEVAHTGQLAGKLRKGHVQWWVKTVQALKDATDARVREEARKLVEG